MLEYRTNVYYNACIHEYMYTAKLHIGIQDYKITRLQDYKITRLQDYKITRLQDYKITRIHEYMIT